MTTVPVIEFKNVSKRFGNCIANQDITFSVEAGTIHGIIGENGAGKSTAMKLLYGLYQRDFGEIKVNGKLCEWSSPEQAIEQGVGMVHQHFKLAEPETVLDNIILGFEPKKFGFWIDRKKARAVCEELSQKTGLQMPWDATIRNIPVGVQQRVEILKTLYRGAEILILDEPTAVLTPKETLSLFETLRQLKSQGKTILIITHKLKEVLALTDHITVFKQGQVSGSIKTQDATIEKLAEMMVGRTVNLHLDVPPQKTGDVVCSVQNLKCIRKGIEKLKSVSFEVKAGEILGIAGVEGNGQSELIKSIMHTSESRYILSGRVHILGKDVTHWSTKKILKLGVGVIPEDRHKQGLLLDSSVSENFILGQHSEYAWFGWFRRRWISAAVERAMERFDVRPRNPDLKIRGFSGGNQQKLVIAREFEKQPKFLIAAQPTRGVDIGAIEFIHQQILAARANGVGVLLVSSELDEVINLSDRILVFYGGNIVAEYSRDEATEQKIGAKMGGHK